MLRECAPPVSLPVMSRRLACRFIVNASAKRNFDPKFDSCLYIRRSIKPGEVIKHTGAVVVFGDVEGEANVCAGGDIIVLGKIRGNCSAGGELNTQSVVFSLNMDPSKIKIANNANICVHNTSPSTAQIALSPSSSVDLPSIDYISSSLYERILRCSKPTRTAFFTGAYISIAGILCFIFPRTIFGLFFSLENVVPGWIQATAVLAIVFGIYYIGTAVGDLLGIRSSYAFYMSTVVGRIFLFCSFCWLFATRALPSPALIIGGVNLLGALCMLAALKP